MLFIYRHVCEPCQARVFEVSRITRKLDVCSALSKKLQAEVQYVHNMD
jgi:hypothetical protein